MLYLSLDTPPRAVFFLQTRGSALSNNYLLWLYTILCTPCSSIIKGQFIPCLKQLVQDGDVDVQYRIR